ncbi:SAM-dependent methyltransferase [Methylibium petroleiphilum]|uniref:Uncharacterized protein n=1 Tax=Methylibium petroleiphilum (strain ATCC BAA-1232 / LMG 22953 / PM1) TaxID=420662 RepID=A2SN58_METPP|nr:SAM-dependent methyltransferase [Methylibium petroleiphilum]ABM96997.1 hypothetical protein Mpe_B0222 [Methylibium petroleiphilum PM1]
MIDLFARPVACLPDEAIPLILGNLRLGGGGWDDKRQQGRLWLRVSDEIRAQIYLLAGLDHKELQRNSVCPSFSVDLFPELKLAIGENMIYSQVDDRSYYLELFQIANGDEYRLYAKYQQIIGSRLMARPAKSMVTAICIALAAQLMEQAKQADSARNAPAPLALARKAMTEQEEINLLLLSGDRIQLPEQHLRHYARIKARIEKAGGSYNAGGYFEFPAGLNAGEVLEQLKGGKVVNPRKDQQFFATPPELALSVIAAAGPLAGKRVLEPSAGDGALADLARAAGAEVVVIENWTVNVLKLEAKGYEVMDRDFLTVTPQEIGLFDAVVANPPFTRGLDMTHVEHMWKFLKPGGTLTVLTSTAWDDGTQRKQQAFRKFLADNNAAIRRIDPGAFKASGTGVGAMHLVLIKTGKAIDDDADEAFDGINGDRCSECDVVSPSGALRCVCCAEAL